MDLPSLVCKFGDPWVAVFANDVSESTVRWWAFDRNDKPLVSVDRIVYPLVGVDKLEDSWLSV